MLFEKGKSGNPSGKSKQDTIVRGMARKHALKAIEALAKIVEDEEAPTASRVSAACALLDRGYGKPAQTLDATIERRTVHELSDAELYDIIRAGRGGPSEEKDSASDADRLH